MLLSFLDVSWLFAPLTLALSPTQAEGKGGIRGCRMMMGFYPHPKSLSLRARDLKGITCSLRPEGEGLGMRVGQ